MKSNSNMQKKLEELKTSVLDYKKSE